MTNCTDIHTNLYEFVMRYLNTHSGQRKQIAEEAGVEYSWLSKVAAGVIKDPGVQRIQRVAAHAIRSGFVPDGVKGGGSGRTYH